MSNLFQVCCKFVIFDQTGNNVLLCQRKGEADFDGTFSFAGGKIENSDNGIRNGIQREKNEELWTNCQVTLYKELCDFAYYVKNDGNCMILPHFLCVFQWWEIILSDEYSTYQWFPLKELATIPNIIDTVAPMADKMHRYRDIIPRLSSLSL